LPVPQKVTKPQYNSREREKPNTRPHKKSSTPVGAKTLWANSTQKKNGKTFEQGDKKRKEKRKYVPGQQKVGPRDAPPGKEPPPKKKKRPHRKTHGGFNGR